jgi:hypothetical protein
MTHRAKCWISCCTVLLGPDPCSCMENCGLLVQAAALHPSCVHLFLPVLSEQRGIIYGELGTHSSGESEGIDGNSAKSSLGDSHPIGARIDWLELSHPSQFACTVSSGCPCRKGIALKGKEIQGLCGDPPWAFFPEASSPPL